MSPSANNRGLDGASLIYTIPSVASQLQPLIYSSLGIQSLLKKQTLKHNVIDRDKVVVPPNWDSWGKIRVLRDGFDVERMSQGWSYDIEEDSIYVAGNTITSDLDDVKKHSEAPDGLPSALTVYEETIQDPRADITSNLHPNSADGKLEVKSQDAQAFLATQLEALDRIRCNGEPGREGSSKLKNQSETETGEESNVVVGSRVNEHIGPIQFNMGGIQVDADDMLKRLKVLMIYMSTETITF